MKLGLFYINLVFFKKYKYIKDKKENVIEAYARGLEPVWIEHLWEFRMRLGVSMLNNDVRDPRKHPDRGGDGRPTAPSGGQDLRLGAFRKI